MLKKLSIAFASAATLLGVTAPANAGSDPYIGELVLTANNYCPQGYLEASGQTLQISQFAPLYSLIGVIYGGDGRVTMRLPNLNGRVPVHYGQGTGLQNNYPWGLAYGYDTTAVSATNFPPHSHNLQASPNQRDTASFNDAMLAQFPAAAQAYADNATNNGPDFALDAITTSGANTGDSQISNMQPSLAMRWCIAVEGTYPPRS